MENTAQFYDEAKPAEEEVELEPSEFEGDIRALILAQTFRQSIENKMINASIQGSLAYYYKKTSILRKVLLGIILAIFLMQKPYWCVELGAEVEPTCEVDAEGREYNVLITTFINPRTSFIISFGIMYFLVISQVLKVQNMKEEESLEVVKMYLQVSLFAISLCISMMETFNFVPKSDFKSIFKILFVMVYFRSILKAFHKMGGMLYRAYSMFVLIVLTIFVFAIMAAVIFEGEEIGDTGVIYGYSFTNLFRSMESLLLLMMMENFPDVLLDAFQISLFNFMFIIAFVFIASVIVIGFTTGVFFNYYKDYYVENIREVEDQYPVFAECIAPVLEERFMDPSYTSEIVRIVEEREKFAGDEERMEMVRASYKQKLRNAMKKLKKMTAQKKQVYFSRMKEIYEEASNSFFYKLITFLLSFYIAVIPALIIDKESVADSADYLQSSELLSFIFAIDLYLKYTFNSDKHFWEFTNICELISIVGVILFANMLYLIPVDYLETNFVGSHALYICWAFSAFFKFTRLHVIMMNYTNYNVIVKTCIHIIPLITDLINMYLVVILLYAALGMTMFGGIINSSFPDKFEEVMDAELDAEAVMYHFNDLPNAILYFVVMNVGGYLDNITQGLAATRVVSKSSVSLFLSRCYFYSFLLITELIIINIIVGFIMEFLELYAGNSDDLCKREAMIDKKQDVIDVLLDRNKELTPEEENELNPPEDDESKSEGTGSDGDANAMDIMNDGEEEKDAMSQDSILYDLERYIKEDQ